uniref:Uncharacterized protein n=1 Tax=Oryza punctata TaxID=4537 RepID=A0A0E0JIB5_ORYPU
MAKSVPALLLAASALLLALLLALAGGAAATARCGATRRPGMVSRNGQQLMAAGAVWVSEFQNSEAAFEPGPELLRICSFSKTKLKAELFELFDRTYDTGRH